MQDLKPGSELAGYRIESIEREDAGASVLRAQDPVAGRVVALHVATEPPGSIATIHFLERAHRLQGLAHPHLLPVYDAVAVDGRALAIGGAPPGRRLDGLLGAGPLAPRQATRIAGQVASAVEALETAGAELPPLTPERVWISAENAFLDPLDGRSLLARNDRPPSAAAALGRLLEAMSPPSDGGLREIVQRAHDGVYFSVGQVSDALRELQEGAVCRNRRRRRVAIAVAVLATIALLVILALAVV